MYRVLIVLVLLLSSSDAFALCKRYRWNHTESTLPSTRIPEYIVCDLETQFPTTNIGEGDVAYAKDSDKFFKRTATAWVEMAGGGGAGTPASTVTSETTFGIAPAVGVDTDYAREDHTHGSPTIADADVPNNITIDLATLATTATTANAGDSATAFFPSGTIEDARIDGSTEADELVLAGDVAGTANANDLDEAATESEIESVVDLADLQGTLPLAKLTDNASANLCLVSGGAGGDPNYTTCPAGTPATTVTSETTLGVIAAVGTATNYAREDHTHGSASESTIEAAVDLQDLQGAVTDAQVPNTITVDLATLATTATTANAGDSATAFFPAGTIEDARIDGSAEVDEIVLAGDVDGAGNSNDIDEAAVETELEGVLDLDQLQGQIADGQIAAGAVDGGAGGEIADGSITADDLATAMKGWTDAGASVHTTTATDNVGIGTSSPDARLAIVADWPSVLATNLSGNFTSYGDVTRLVLRRANGSEAGPTTGILNGDTTGNFNFRGYHSGGAFHTGGGASVGARAEEDYTATTQGTALFFSTVSNGTNLLTERVTITNSGNLGVNTTGPLARVAINGGLHVGGDSDPGDNNALIDGTLEVTGAVTLTTDLGIGSGGTGQSTATAAFDALAPTTTQGDVIYHNGSDNVRLAKGTAGQVLTMNAGATAPEWATAGSGSWPTGKLTSPVAVAVNASYVTVFTITPQASKSNLLHMEVFHSASATTVGVQFRVSSADAGNVGNCLFQTKGIAGTAASATAEEYDNIAIGAAPADTAAAAASNTTLNLVVIDCAFTSDGSPGGVLLEAQLETGTTSINILAPSYYILVNN